MEPDLTSEQQLALNRANDAAIALRTARLWAHERVSGLTALVFGLSFLALNVSDPTRIWLVVFAWVFLGSATGIAALIGLAEWQRRERMLHEARVDVRKLDRGEPVGEDKYSQVDGVRVLVLMHISVLFGLVGGIVSFGCIRHRQLLTTFYVEPSSLI